MPTHNNPRPRERVGARFARKLALSDNLETVPKRLCDKRIRDEEHTVETMLSAVRYEIKSTILNFQDNEFVGERLWTLYDLLVQQIPDNWLLSVN